jgi:hypothetical protein
MAFYWNKENKHYTDQIKFRQINKIMVAYRKKHRGTIKERGWKNFDIRHLMNFINEHLYWG